MKKNPILYILIIMLGAIIPIKITLALNFPDKIRVTYSDLIGKYGWNLYKKSYSVEGSDVSGKAFCSSFWNLAPNTTCTRTKWSNNSDNSAVSAAVGNIIKSLRSSDSSITWDNYFYGELAINKFIYDNKLGGNVNNINSAPKTLLNHIKPYVDKAIKIYNDYGKDSVKITKFTINGVSPNSSGKINVRNTNTEKYLVKVEMKCYDKSNKQITCDLAKSDGNIWITESNKTAINSVPKKVNVNGKTVTITFDITNFVVSHQNENINIKVNVSNRVKYNYAQRYNCNGNNQTITPNYLKVDYSKRQSDNKQVLLSVSSPPPSESNKSCESLISSDPVSNAKLYMEHKNDKTYGKKLLDINNPSCGNLVNNDIVDCESSTISREWIVENFNGTNYTAFCKINFKFNNSVYNNNVSSKGNLLYSNSNKTIDGSFESLFGEGIISYDCNIPELYNNPTGTIQTIELNENELLSSQKIDTLNLEVFGSTISLNGRIDLDTVAGSCYKDNNTIKCNNYSNPNKGFGWNFTANVNYRYANSNKYKLENGKMVLQQNNNIPDFRYGILIPESFNDSKGTMKLYFGENASDTATCNFEVINDNIQSSINFRTIDVKKPFLKADGKTRYTGGNWCGNDVSEESEVENVDFAPNVKDINRTNSECIYKGDINKNFEWDDDDVFLIGNIVAERNFVKAVESDEDSGDRIRQKTYEIRSILNDKSELYINDIINDVTGLPIRVNESIADINNDGVIQVKDMTIIQSLISFYSKYSIGDVNMDGSIDSNDVFAIENMLLEQDNSNSLVLKITQEKLANFDNSDGKCEVNEADITALREYIESGIENDVETEIVDGNLLDASENDVKENVRSQYCKGDSTNSSVKKYITNRPDSNGNKPIYSFTLDAKTIKSIRENNKEYKYNQNSGEKFASSYLMNLYNSISDSNALCYNETNDNGYCDVEGVLKKAGVIE